MENSQSASLADNYNEEREHRQRTRKPLMIVGMVSIVMLFAGLTSAYIVRQADGNWLTFDLPSSFYISTVLLVASSATLWWAQKAVKKNDFTSVKLGMGLTLLLSLAFVISQFVAYGAMTEQGLFFVKTNVSVSFLYIITFAHLLHLIGGIIALTVSWVKSMKELYTAENRLGLELTAMYWHFLDALWIYLLLFLLFIR